MLPVLADDLNLADYYLFDRLREGFADTPAILFGEQRHSYREVAHRARSFARFLASVGVRREERVLIILHDTPAFAWAFFGTLHQGAVVAMGNPEAPAEDLAYLVEYTRATVVVTIGRVAQAIEGALGEAKLRALVACAEVATGGDVLAPSGYFSAKLAAGPGEGVVELAAALARGAERLSDPALAPQKTHRDDVAIWLFTSGSTGRPKANLHAHGAFAFNTEVYAKQTVGYRAGAVTVSVPRLSFGCATGTNLMFPFAVGATAGLFAERPTPESLSQAIARYRPTIVTNVPTMMGKLLDHDEREQAAGRPALDFSSVRFHLSAGEALPEPLLRRFTERFGAEVYDGIGSAEMFHIYCSNRPGDVKPGTLGRVVTGYELKILPAEASEPGGEPIGVI